LRRLGVTP